MEVSNLFLRRLSHGGAQEADHDNHRGLQVPRRYRIVFRYAGNLRNCKEKRPEAPMFSGTSSKPRQERDG